MTEDNNFKLMLEIAWKGIEQTQQVTYKIDEKANNTLTLSALLMAVVGGILVGVVNAIHPLFLILLLIVLILLAISIYYAMKTMWLKKQEILDVKTTFNIINPKDYIQSYGDFAISIAGWQERANKIHDEKNYYLRKSMKWLIGALIFIILSALMATILKLIFSFEALEAVLKTLRALL